MENATKALEMAAEVLIGILILSVIVYFISVVQGMQQKQDILQDEEKVRQYNEEWNIFNKTMTYGADVISVANKVIDHNEKYNDLGASDTYRVTLEVTLLWNTENTPPSKYASPITTEIINRANRDAFDNAYKMNTETFKTRVFKSTANDTNNDGLIDRIIFTEINSYQNGTSEWYN